MLSGKRILLGICGGIAAYKCPELVRRLKEQGASVRVAMTDSAKKFVSPLSLQVVSGHLVSDNLFDPFAESSMGHIELAKWADLILVAPATANTIAKLTVGIADDLLTTLCLATSAKIAIAPAMNQQMYAAPSTEKNIHILHKQGYLIFGPDIGEQACGDIGAGRMLQPEDLLKHIQHYFHQREDLLGLSVVLTAGPTREAIDPVRFISNHSSGKMGFAIAQAAVNRGAKVVLISGPVSLPTPRNVTRIDVESAEEMLNASMAQAEKCTIFIACAAVADYRATEIAPQKLKKKGDRMQITLTRNPDIVADVAAMTHNRPFVVGFAAETNDVSNYAQKKLKQKQLDLICANDVSSKDSGFNSDYNALQLFWKNGEIMLPFADKLTLSNQIIDQILKLYEKKH